MQISAKTRERVLIGVGGADVITCYHQERGHIMIENLSSRIEREDCHRRASEMSKIFYYTGISSKRSRIIQPPHKELVEDRGKGVELPYFWSANNSTPLAYPIYAILLVPQRNGVRRYIEISFLYPPTTPLGGLFCSRVTLGNMREYSYPQARSHHTVPW